MSSFYINLTPTRRGEPFTSRYIQDNEVGIATVQGQYQYLFSLVDLRVQTNYFITLQLIMMRESINLQALVLALPTTSLSPILPINHSSQGFHPPISSHSPC